MKVDLSNIATLLVALIVFAVVVVGGISVLTDRYDDDVRQWMNDLVFLAGAVGLLGVGRGIAAKKRGGAS